MTLAVLLAHALVFAWLAQQQAATAALRLMPAPLYTRLLQPEIVPANPAHGQEETAAPVPRSRVTITATPTASKSAESTQTVAPVAEEIPASLTAAPKREPAVIDSVASRTATMTTATTAADAMPVATGNDPPIGVNPSLPTGSAATGTATDVTAGTVAVATPTVIASATSTVTVTTTATAAATTAAPQDGWPGDTRLNYQLTGYFRGALLGSARVHWQRQGNRYQARVEIEPNLPGSGRVLTSQGEVTPQGLLPGAYEEVRLGKSRGARMGETTIVLSDGREVPRPQGVQDSASQFVELSHRFASGKEVLEVGRAVSLWIARPGAVDLWTYDIVGREILKSAQLGEIETFRLKPRPIANARGNITAEMWFAPSLQYLPVRIRVTMGDDAFVDLMVNTIEQR